jgi:hypothetical protein
MLADPRGARHWRRRRLESLRLRYLDYQAPPPRPTNADLPVAARAPGARGAICADRHWNRICGVSSAAREQLVEERAIAEKREVPKRLRCHRFEVGPTVRIRFAPAQSQLRARFDGSGRIVPAIPVVTMWKTCPAASGGVSRIQGIQLDPGQRSNHL